MERGVQYLVLGVLYVDGSFVKLDNRHINIDTSAEDGTAACIGGVACFVCIANCLPCPLGKGSPTRGASNGRTASRTI